MMGRMGIQNREESVMFQKIRKTSIFLKLLFVPQGCCALFGAKKSWVGFSQLLFHFKKKCDLRQFFNHFTVVSESYVGIKRGKTTVMLLPQNSILLKKYAPKIKLNRGREKSVSPL